MIAERLNYYKRVGQFAGVRLGNYIELGMLDLALYKAALIKTVVAYVAMAFCGVFALAFLSVAVLVSFWTTDHRIVAAWCVFGVWALLALIALMVAKKGAPDDVPTSTVAEQIRLDIATIKGEHE